jgi:hypothetical protein
MAKLIEEFKTEDGETFQLFQTGKSFRTQFVHPELGVWRATKHKFKTDADKRTELFRPK